MEKIDIILWVLSGGFGLMLIMWHNLHSRIDGVEKGLNTRIDRLDARIDRIEARIDKTDEHLKIIEKDLQQVTTKIAVMESKLTDISSNVSHLMWHHQALPPKEAKEL